MSNLLISQFQAKIRRFGWWRTALYSLEFAVQPIYRAAWTRPVRKSYSQRYEDVEVDDLLGRPAEGFYVDVGANHPSTLSNTRRFYERGWSGINIEPNPARIPLFRQQRPRDVTLNCGVGEGEGS